MAVPDSALFRSRPLFRTSDPGEYEEWMKSAVTLRLMNVHGSGHGFKSELNCIELPGLALIYGRYGEEVQLDLRLNDFVQEFPLAAAAEGQWNGRGLIFGPGDAGLVGGAGDGGLMTYRTGYAHTMQTLSSDALARKLSAMTGMPVDPPLEMSRHSCSDPSAVAMQLRLIRFLSDESERSEGLMPPIVMAEIEQAIIVAFLTANEHNYSRWLKGTPRSAAPWQVRRAVDYIEANWDRPISIENLVEATNTTAQSLFYLFRKTYGQSPIAYAGQVRLRHARSMLSAPTPQTTVGSVGFACGFSNLGHFAKKYFMAFGELPSDTLRKSR